MNLTSALKILLLLCLSFFSAFCLTLLEPAADAKLYIHLAEKLMNEGGYTDTIRNQEILPSIGHPLLLGLLKNLWFSYEYGTRFLLSLGFFFSSLSLYVSIRRPYLSFLSPLIFYLFFDNLINIAGAESGLVLSFSLLTLSLALLSQKRNLLNSFFFVSSLSFTLLIRPVFYPLALLICPLLSLYFLWKKRFKAASIALFPLVIVIAVSMLSIVKEGDRRYLTGTYSAITLLSGMNDYIDLQSEYYSVAWRSAGDEATSFIKSMSDSSNGWQYRDKKIKSYVFNFVLTHPWKAVQAYFYRLSKYTVASGSILYVLVFILFFFESYKEVKRLYRTKKIGPSTLSVLGGVYLICIHSLFPYSGTRYLTVCFIFMLGCLGLLWPKFNEEAGL